MESKSKKTAVKTCSTAELLKCGIDIRRKVALTSDRIIIRQATLC